VFAPQQILAISCVIAQTDLAFVVAWRTMPEARAYPKIDTAAANVSLLYQGLAIRQQVGESFAEYSRFI
jgi:hypothetical protein